MQHNRPTALVNVRKWRRLNDGRLGPLALIEYRVRLADPRRHFFEVDCCVDCASDSEIFELPSWIPGSYLLREYARHVVRAEAIDAEGRPARVEKISHNAWRCDAVAGILTFRLTVYALDESVRGAWLDTRRAWFNGPCLFALPSSARGSECVVILEPPGDAALVHWHVATSMRPRQIDSRGYGSYFAADYDELLDHPFLIGNLERVSFDVSGVSHELVVSGRHASDLERVAGDLRRLCEAQIAFFGGTPPFDRYVFLCILVASGYGGLEHRSSSSLMFQRENLPAIEDDRVSVRYERMLSLASHEYFHAWHVKRTRPAAFMPYDLSRRNFTRLLWAFEGITSYYQDRFLLRCGLIDDSAYLRRLGEQISSVLRVPGRHVQSLAESSFDAWDKLYKPDPNSVNVGVSYYSKGALVALALDLEIRRRHESQCSLDTVVQALWREFGAQNIGVPENGFELLARKIAGDELAEFFDTAIRETSDPPLAELFADFAVEMRLEARRNGREKEHAGLWLGVAQRPCAAGIECTAVLDGGPAQQAGLNPGDVIVALDRLRVTAENFETLLGSHGSGEEVSVTAFRGDELLEFVAKVTPAPNDVCTLQMSAEATAPLLARRRDWLGT
jgi:predicted metalloprotease with PDZ domain